MKPFVFMLSIAALLGACKSEHKHAPAPQPSATSASTTSRPSLSAEERERQFVVGAGFGWRKQGQSSDKSPTTELDLALSYGFKIHATDAQCDSQQICKISEFELRLDEKILLKFPHKKDDQFLVVNLDKHECPLLLKRGNRVVILLPHQRGTTAQSIVLDAVKIENGNFLEVLPNVATWRDEILPQDQAESLFARAFPQ